MIISIIDTLNEHSDFLLPKKYFLPTNDNHNNKYHKCLFSWFMSNSHTLAYTYMSERRTHFADMRRVCLTLFRIMTNIVFITIISVNGVIFFFSFHSFAREFLYDECHHLFVCLDYYYDYFSARWVKFMWMNRDIWTRIIITLLKLNRFSFRSMVKLNEVIFETKTSRMSFLMLLSVLKHNERKYET